MGRIGCAGWLETFKHEFLGFQTLVNVDPWGILIHAVGVFPLGSDLSTVENLFEIIFLFYGKFRH